MYPAIAEKMKPENVNAVTSFFNGHSLWFIRQILLSICFKQPNFALRIKSDFHPVKT